MVCDLLARPGWDCPYLAAAVVVGCAAAAAAFVEEVVVTVAAVAAAAAAAIVVVAVEIGAVVAFVAALQFASAESCAIDDILVSQGGNAQIQVINTPVLAACSPAAVATAVT